MPNQRSYTAAPQRPMRRAVATAVAAGLFLTTGLVSAPASATPRAAKVPPAPATHLVTVGSNPYDVAISQSLGKAFVVNDGGVSVVSLLTQRQLYNFDTGGYHSQNSIALMRNNTQGYITNFDKKTVAVFDTETHKVIRQIPVGLGAVDVVKANTPKGQRAYVAILNTKRLVGIQTATGKVAQKIKIPAPAQTVTSAPDGKSVWAGSETDTRIFKISTSSGKVTRTMNVGPVGPVTSIAFTPDKKRVWVAGLGGAAVLDANTGKAIKFLPILKIFKSKDPNMGALALTGSGRYVYIQDSTWPGEGRTGSISMIDTKTYRILHHIPTGILPEGLAIDTKRDVAYVPNYNDDTLTYFNVPR